MWIGRLGVWDLESGVWDLESGVWAKHHSTEYGVRPNPIHSMARHRSLESVLELHERIEAEVYLAAAMNCGRSCSSQLISPLYMNEISI